MDNPNMEIKVKGEGLEPLENLAVKDGYKTTEFWLTAVATLLGLLMASGVVESGTQWDKAIGAGITLLSALGYQVTRTQVKK